MNTNILEKASHRTPRNGIVTSTAQISGFALLNKQYGR